MCVYVSLYVSMHTCSSSIICYVSVCIVCMNACLQQYHNNYITHNYQGVTVVTPYVGMARKQDGGSNGCISNYTAINRLGAGFAHP